MNFWVSLESVYTELYTKEDAFFIKSKVYLFIVSLQKHML